jgi:hypothetical protein
MAKLLGLWGAAIAVLTAVSIETGGAPLRFLRSPVGLIVLGTLVGYSIYKGTRFTPLDAPREQNEDLPIVNRVLRLAREHKGRLTVAEVLAETTLSLPEAQKTLDELAYAGACQLIVGERGMQIYYFAEFENTASKESDALSDVQKHAGQATKT